MYPKLNMQLSVLARAVRAFRTTRQIFVTLCATIYHPPVGKDDTREGSREEVGRPSEMTTSILNGIACLFPVHPHNSEKFRYIDHT